MYIVIEGPDGSGKNSQVDALAAHFQRLGQAVTLVEEPDATFPHGSLLRQLIAHEQYPETLAPLFLAVRLSVLIHKVKPALDQGHIVISSRSFLSSLVHQQEQWPLEWLMDLHRLMPVKPNVMVVLDAAPSISHHRVLHRGKPLEFFENLDLMERAYLRYIDLANIETLGPLMAPEGRVHMIDAEGTIDEIHRRVLEVL